MLVNRGGAAARGRRGSLSPSRACSTPIDELSGPLAPVGYAGASVKVSPPLGIGEEPLRESVQVLEEAMAEVIEE